jgi:hypothetical protein
MLLKAEVDTGHEKKPFLYIHAMAPTTVMAKTIKPIHPLRLSCFISQIKNAKSGSTNIPQKISEGAVILFS